MDGGQVTISISTLWNIAGFALQLVVLGGGIVWSHGQLSQRVKAVEAHGDKVDQIAPLQAAFEALKSSVNTEFRNMREDLRDLAKSVRDLAQAERRP